MDKIKTYLAVAGGVVVAVAAAFGVTEFVQPSPLVTVLIQAAAMLVVAFYNRAKPVP